MSVAFWEGSGHRKPLQFCSPPSIPHEKKKIVIPRITEMGKGEPVHPKTNYSRRQGLDPGETRLSLFHKRQRTESPVWVQD